MAFRHNQDIVWDELFDAFTMEQGDRVYFLDRMTGEIFFVPAALEDDNFWRQMENNRERFLEIPRVDYGSGRRLISRFIEAVEDEELKKILESAPAGRKPFGRLDEILSFFPDEEERLMEMRDEFFANRLKNWLEENNLYSVEMDSLPSPRI